jgi:hypothetical protein
MDLILYPITKEIEVITAIPTRQPTKFLINIEDNIRDYFEKEYIGKCHNDSLFVKYVKLLQCGEGELIYDSLSGECNINVMVLMECVKLIPNMVIVDTKVTTMIDNINVVYTTSDLLNKSIGYIEKMPFMRIGQYYPVQLRSQIIYKTNHKTINHGGSMYKYVPIIYTLSDQAELSSSKLQNDSIVDKVNYFNNIIKYLHDNDKTELAKFYIKQITGIDCTIDTLNNMSEEILDIPATYNICMPRLDIILHGKLEVKSIASPNMKVIQKTITRSVQGKYVILCDCIEFIHIILQFVVLPDIKNNTALFLFYKQNYEQYKELN